MSMNICICACVLYTPAYSASKVAAKKVIILSVSFSHLILFLPVTQLLL